MAGSYLKKNHIGEPINGSSGLVIGEPRQFLWCPFPFKQPLWYCSRIIVTFLNNPTAQESLSVQNVDFFKYRNKMFNPLGRPEPKPQLLNTDQISTTEATNPRTYFVTLLMLCKLYYGFPI